MKMILVTTENIPGYTYHIKGLCRGGMVQSKHIGSDIGASFKTIVGGELKGYTDMMNKAREMATQRMIEQAAAMGADAIVSVRYMSSAVMAGAAEVVAYGTAVKLNNA